MGDPRFQKFDPVEHPVKSIAHRIRNQVMIEDDAPIGPPPLTRLPDDPSRNADDCHIWRNILYNDRIGSDARASANHDWTQNLGAGTNQDAALDRRMTLARRPARSAKGNAMVKRDIIADLRCLANHNPRAMIDEEPPPNCCSRMNVDICYEASQPREQPRWKPQIPLPEPVCKTIKDDRMHTRIGENDFKRMPRRWIARLYATDVFA